MNDMVHVQWTGNDDTNNNGYNNGEGTNSEDRHNIVQLSSSGMSSPMPQNSNQQNMFDVAWEWNPDTSPDFGGARDRDELTKQFALSKQTGCDTDPNKTEPGACGCNVIGSAMQACRSIPADRSV